MWRLLNGQYKEYLRYTEIKLSIWELDYTNPITKNDNLIRLVKNQNNSQKIYRDSFVEIEKEKLRYKKKLYNESYKELVDGGIIKFVNKEIIDDMIYQSKLRGCLIG